MARELTQKRKRRAKIFDVGGGRRRMELRQRPIHFRRNGRWEEFNLQSRFECGHHVVDQAPFVLRIADDLPSYRFTSDIGRSIEVTLRFSIASSLEHNGIKHRWNFIGSNASYVLSPTTSGCSALVILHSPDAPKVWEWDIIGDHNLLAPIKGFDSAGRKLELLTSWNGDRLRVEWTGRAIDQKLLRKNKKIVLTDSVTYPVKIDPTVNESITAGQDDGCSNWSNGTNLFVFNTTATNMIVGGTIFSTPTPGTGGWYLGLRFQSVAIPKQANIIASSLIMRAIGLAGTPNIAFYGVDVADAAAWANPANRMKEVTKTTAKSVFASFVAAASNTISVTGPVAEVLGGTGWSTNNALALVGQRYGWTDGNHWVSLAAYEHTTLSPPRLDITYSIAGGGGGDNVVGTGLTRSILLIPHHLVNN